MRKSITLIELIAAIVVFAVAVPSLFMFFSSAVRMSHQQEVVATASLVAGNYIEEIRAGEYSDDTNEIDDWDGYAADDVYDASYHVGVEVSYVDGDSLEDLSPQADSGYQKIVVTVTHSPDIRVVKETIVTSLGM